MANRKVKLAKAAVTYKLSGRASIGGVKPEVIGAELARIYTQHGELKTKQVVDEARPEDAALHPAFEWDDDVAGERYREIQARSLIRAIEIVNPKTQESRSVYVHVPAVVTTGEDKSGAYEAIDVIVNKPDKFVLALAFAQSRVDSAKQAVEDLRAASGESDHNADRMAALTIAAMALQTARDAVASIH